MEGRQEEMDLSKGSTFWLDSDLGFVSVLHFRIVGWMVDQICRHL